MRDLHDVREAFAMLEGRADAYLPCTTFADSYGSVVTDIGCDTGGRATPSSPTRRHGRRIAAVVTAATVAAAAVVITLVVATPTSTPKHGAAATAPAVPTTPAAPAYRRLPLRSLVFVLDRPSTRLTATDVSAADQAATYADASGLTFTVTAHATTEGRPFGATSTSPVSVDGRPGAYGLVDADDTSDESEGIAWRYGPGEWATVRGEAGQLTRSEALDIARAVRFDTQPLRSPVSIALPTARLHDWSSTQDQQTSAIVVLRVDGHPAQVSVQHEPVRRTSHPTTVNGRAAYASDRGTSLDVDLGSGYSMTVFSVHGDPGSASPIAAAVTVCPRPGDASTWFPATSALPG